MTRTLIILGIDGTTPVYVVRPEALDAQGLAAASGPGALFVRRDHAPFPVVALRIPRPEQVW
jgi:hypothetical protein